MRGLRGFGCVFQRRRKRSSRNCAMKSKKPIVVVTPPSPDSRSVEEPSRASDWLIPHLCFRVPDWLIPDLRFRALFSALGWLVHKCRNTIHQVCGGLLRALLFSRGQAERVEALHQKVEALQKEVSLLRSALKLSGGAQSAGVRCEEPDGVQNPTPLALPPPPPPPLPAPAPKVSVIPRKTAQTSTLKKPNVAVAVTLRDLQAVRLRRVTAGQKPQVSPDRRRSPLVTLADLQKVRLRRSRPDLLTLRSRPSLIRTPTKNPPNLRVPLRKVNLIRSPGGTPLCNKENDGLDPDMASGNQRLRALTSGLSPLQSL
ncbi:proline-rich protein 11 [Pseudorasbora parva]|uniref:proline-rich protein 11 n=1 Tax=Pseudorasbora parva TaxID=51549 RepID=UPI00351E51CB